MNATEAIKVAKEHLALVMPDTESLRIEAVNSIKKTGHWVVKISFFDDDAAVPSALLASRNREYKAIEMDKKGGLISILMISR
jgi:hypothetical protein